MSHAQQIKAAKIMSNALSFSPDHSVLEIGSYDVNGTVRAIFNSSDYTGIDLVSGPTVNEVVSGHEINFSRKFDFVISFECFEHNPHWVETLDKMILHAEDNGYLIITCASHGRIEHGTARTNPNHSPGTSSIGWNYYKNLSENDILPLLENNPKIKDFIVYTQNNTYDLYVVCSLGNQMQDTVRNKIMNDFKMLNSVNWSLYNIINQLWYIPVRCLFKLIGDRPLYQSIVTKYFKYTKGIIGKIFKKK